MRAPCRTVALLVMLAISPTLLRAQAGPDTPVSSDSTIEVVPTSSTGSLDEPVMQPEMEPTFAERVDAPRTLRDYWHLFIAFALAWALLFGYALTLGRRFRRLERDVQRLEDRQ